MLLPNRAEIKAVVEVGEAVLREVAPGTAEKLSAEAASLYERGHTALAQATSGHKELATKVEGIFTDLFGQPRTLPLLKSLEIKESKFPGFAERLGELPRSTETSYEKRSVTADATNKFMRGEMGLGDFAASVKKEEAPARLHKLANGTDLIVPTDYALALGQVRGLRLGVEKENNLAKLFSAKGQALGQPDSKLLSELKSFASNGDASQTLPSLLGGTQWTPEVVARALGRNTISSEAKMLHTQDLRDEVARLESHVALSQHGLRARLLPEDVPTLLRTLPNSSLVSRVNLLGEPSRPYLAESALKWEPRSGSARVNLDFQASASRSERSITFYQPNSLERDGESLIGLFRHEQTHLNHDPLYGIARSVDPEFEASKYGEWNNEESEAELESKSFLSSDVATFESASQKAPARMAVLANKLIRTIESADPSARSADAEQILARAAWIKQSVVPGQVQKIIGLVENTADENRAQELMQLLNSL